MKQSKTTLKELTAMYRSVLKRAFIAGVIAVATAGTANADYTDAQIDTMFTNAQNSLTTALAQKETNMSAQLGYDVTHNPENEAAQGSLINSLTMNTGKASTDKVSSVVDAINANTTAINGIGQSILGVGYQTTLQSNWVALDGYEVDTTNYSTTSEYNNATHTPIVLTAGAAQDGTKYTYLLANGTTSNVSVQNVDETMTVAVSGLSSKSGVGISLNTATAGWDDTTPSVGDYSITTTGGTTYTLGKNGDDFILAGVTTPLTASEEYILTTLTNAYETDANNVSAAIDTLENHLVLNQAALDAAEDAYNADTPVVTALGNYKTANDTYNASLGKAVDAHLLASDGAAAMLLAEKEANMSAQLGYDVTKNPANTTEANSLTNKLDSHDTDIVSAINTNYNAIDAEATTRFTADTTLQANITAEATRAQAAEQANATAISNEATARENADTTLQANITAETNARIAAINAEATTRATNDAFTLASAKAYSDGNLALANNYTDAKIDDLDKDLSGGIAAATALSAVEVSNVKKGEVSVGGGYGHYNGESAGAFGAAMGLSDNWSVNVGAGIHSSNTAFRAGTNYKFKLF